MLHVGGYFLLSVLYPYTNVSNWIVRVNKFDSHGCIHARMFDRRNCIFADKLASACIFKCGNT